MFLVCAVSSAQQHQHRHRQFSFTQIASECFASEPLSSCDIDAIVVDLVGGADFLSKRSQRILCCSIRLAQHSSKLRGRGEERTGFNLYDEKIFLVPKMQI